MARHPSTAGEGVLEVRPARLEDREQISNLISVESHVHKHLDWRGPLEWLGYRPFWVLLEGPRISGALACPPDPAPIAWIRLFVFSSHIPGAAAWRSLWDSARRQLVQAGGATAAAIATQRWLDPILIAHGFQPASHIVLLELNTANAPRPQIPEGCLVRPMTPKDLPDVVEVDAAAFNPLWHNSLEALTDALGVASYASVVENRSGLVGYQISTGGAFGTHLARLAVRPAEQGRGVGAALVHDLIGHIPPEREPRLTVNTQANNAASLALYCRLGFRRTGERFPVLTLAVSSLESASPSKGGLE
jgi:ribosomal-protein-alanine N-acetyltransferase